MTPEMGDIGNVCKAFIFIYLTQRTYPTKLLGIDADMFRILASDSVRYSGNLSRRIMDGVISVNIVHKS